MPSVRLPQRSLTCGMGYHSRRHQWARESHRFVERDWHWWDSVMHKKRTSLVVVVWMLQRIPKDPCEIVVQRRGKITIQAEILEMNMKNEDSPSTEKWGTALSCESVWHQVQQKPCGLAKCVLKAREGDAWKKSRLLYIARNLDARSTTTRPWMSSIPIETYAIMSNKHPFMNAWHINQSIK